MTFEKIHNKGQAQLFKNQYLEVLTKTHPLVIWGIYFPMVIGFPLYAANRFGFDSIRITLIFLALYLVMAENVFVFFPGFLLGYLMYGSMHFAIHAWNPPFKWMKPLWRNHHLHHYKQQEKGFGVSTTLWDRVFGTMFDLNKEKEDKEKVKDLMFK